MSPTRLGWSSPNPDAPPRYASLTYVRDAAEAARVAVRLSRAQEAGTGPTPEDTATTTNETTEGSE